MRKYINKFFNCNKNKIELGRWNLKYNENVLNRIIYLANQDNCGCCEIINNDNYYYPFIL